MEKDKVIGLVLMIISIVLAVSYSLGSVVDLYLETIGGIPDGFRVDFLPIDFFDWRLFVVVPIWLLVVLISIIALWIGYSMLTTPAPIPLEELEEELSEHEH